MNRDSLTSSIIEHEGYRKTPYKDHLGIWTVGYGTNIHNRRLQDAHLQTVGSLLEWLCDPVQHQAWLDEHIDRSINEARDWLGLRPWNILSDAQREVIAEMFYQMGATRMSAFVKFKSALRGGNYPLAKREMLDSRWARQTPGRALDLSEKFYS
tara:strand:+ start:25927 stop:26388 length:462 start_codon:yes stop_codon:yes gene_type:complete